MIIVKFIFEKIHACPFEKRTLMYIISVLACEIQLFSSNIHPTQFFNQQTIQILNANETVSDQAEDILIEFL